MATNSKTQTADDFNVGQAAKELGIVFGEPPAPPRKNERDDDLWKGVHLVLSKAPGQWAKVKTWDRPERAGQVASSVNNGKHKTFPANDGWAARYERTSNQDKSGTSSLWLCYKPVDGQSPAGTEQ